jgi:hypothetical protein
MTQMGRDFFCLLHIWPVFHHMEHCPDLSWGLSPVARSALLTSTHWISSWPLIGQIGECRDLSMLRFQTQELINMVCHLCILTECLEEERTFLVASWWRVHVSLDSILTVVFIVLPECLFFFHFSSCFLLHTKAVFISQYALCTYCDVHIFLSIFHGTELHILWGSWSLLLKSAPDPVDATGLCFFSLFLSPDPQLLCIGCCPLLNLQCLPIIAQFER